MKLIKNKKRKTKKYKNNFKNLMINFNLQKADN